MEKDSSVLQITHIASGDLWAGAEVQICNLIKAQLQTGGVQLSVILLNEGVLARKLRQMGVDLHVLPERESRFFQLLREVVSLVREKSPPHIVHSHRRKENLLAALAAFPLPGVYSIRTVHGAPEPVKRALALKQGLLRSMDWLVGRFLQSAIVAVSEELGARLSKVYGSRNVRVVSNGIDVAELLARADSQSFTTPRWKQRVKVAFVGRLVPIKRPDLFLEAARMLVARAPEHYEFYIFGDGPLTIETEEYLKKHGLLEWVHCMGFREDIVAWLAEMDLLLMVSDHEGLPMTLLECLALGVPVVARRVGGIPQVLGNGDAGWMVEDTAPESIVQAILELQQDPSKKQRIIDAGRRRVAQHFSAAACADQYREIYRGLVMTVGQQPGSRKGHFY